MQTVDVIVVGTGSAGKTVAQAAAQAGRSVVIVDKEPMGGTCSQRGCDPKKILVGAAELVARTHWMTGNGIAAPARIDWPALMAFKKTFTDPIPERTEAQFSEQGIQLRHGVATFTGPNRLRVGETEYEAGQIVLATGARPRPLGVPGEPLLIDSTAFLELPRLPADLVLVGGGYIACEFAHVAAHAGSRVTILHQGAQLLDGFDPDLVALLAGLMAQDGITIQLNARVVAIDGQAGQLTVRYEQAGTTHALDTALAVHAAGREPDVADLALDRAGVTSGEKGIVVNQFLQSVSNPAVYACGDVADKGLPLTPLASYEGKLVAHNLLNGNSRPYEEQPTPTTVFTIPPLASVGLTEAQARAQHRDVRVAWQATPDWYSSRRIGEPVSGFKTLVDADTGLVVGAHRLGFGSEEVINLFALAMRHGITAEALGKTRFAYPTHASDVASMKTEKR